MYRVWYPTNTEMHLGTFLVLFTKGTNMTCLKIVHREPGQADYKFQEEHGKLKGEPDKPGSCRRSSRLRRPAHNEEEDGEEYLLYLHKGQSMKKDCWIDIINPWNINWQQPYLYVYCGCLDKISFGKAREQHWESYRRLVRGS